MFSFYDVVNIGRGVGAAWKGNPEITTICKIHTDLT